MFSWFCSIVPGSVGFVGLAFQTQRMYERDARGGTRYREIVQSHFGVLDPNDARLQRPEYLGGGVSPIMLTPVPQTHGTMFPLLSCYLM